MDYNKLLDELTQEVAKLPASTAKEGLKSLRAVIIALEAAENGLYTTPEALDNIRGRLKFLLEEYENNSKTIKINLLGDGVGVQPQSCTHEWSTYIGLNSMDTYCKKCGEKK